MRMSSSTGVAATSTRADHGAIAQNGGAIADSFHFLQAVRDVNNGNAALLEILDHPEKMIDFVGRQHRRRLVHDDDSGIQRQRFGDFHHLLLGYAQALDDGFRSNLDVERGQDFARLLEQFLAVDDSEPAIEQRFASQENVFRDAHLGNKIEFLVNGADPQLLRIVGTADMHWLALEQNLARVGGINAGKDFDEGGLARPVLAQQHMHLGGPRIEVHALERKDAGEMLDDPAHFNKRSDFFYAH